MKKVGYYDGVVKDIKFKGNDDLHDIIFSAKGLRTVIINKINGKKYLIRWNESEWNIKKIIDMIIRKGDELK